MNSTASTVGAYLRDLPPDRRVAMARLCSMIRRSARGVRESMRYGLAFYELDGPLFALESGRRHMSLYVAEKDVVLKHKDALTGVNANKSFIKFSDLNRLPLDVVEKIVRDSVAARRQRGSPAETPAPSQEKGAKTSHDEAEGSHQIVRAERRGEVEGELQGEEHGAPFAPEGLAETGARVPEIDPTLADNAANTLRSIFGISGSMCLAISAGAMVLAANTRAKASALSAR